MRRVAFGIAVGLITVGCSTTHTVPPDPVPNLVSADFRCGPEDGAFVNVTAVVRDAELVRADLVVDGDAIERSAPTRVDGRFAQLGLDLAAVADLPLTAEVRLVDLTGGTERVLDTTPVRLQLDADESCG